MARVVVASLAALLFSACAGSPAQPAGFSFSAGRWSGGSACLSVAAGGCDLVVGCGHGQFPLPVVAMDGTFQVTGTYRIEAGPVSLDPPPAAKFSGAVSGQSLTLTVTPTDPSLRPATYVLQLTGGSGKCGVLCV